MQLISLRMQNCRQHADTSVPFPSEGITGILGASEAGKSTVLECALWALFGTDALRSSVDEMRWHRAPATRKAEAELVFSLGGKTYRVHRTEKTAHVYEGDDAAPIAAGTSTVNGYLKKNILHMSLDEFTRSHVCLQKDLTALASMKPTPRQEFVREVLSLTVLDRALEGCRKSMNDMKRELDGLKVRLGDREPLAGEWSAAAAADDAASQSVSDLTEQHARATAARARAHELYNALAAAATEHDRLVRLRDTAAERKREAREQTDKLTAQLTAADEAGHELGVAEAALAKLVDRRDALQRDKECDEQRRNLVRSIVAAEMDLRALDESIEQYNATISAYDVAAFQAARDLHTQRTRALQVIREVQSTAKGQAREAALSAEKEADKARRKIAAIESAGADGACPTCLRELGNAIDVVLEQLRIELAEAEFKHTEAVKLTDTYAVASDDELIAEEDVKAAEQAVKGHRVRQTKADTAQHELVRAMAPKNRSLEQLTEQRLRLQELPEPARYDTTEIEDLTRQISSLSGDVARLRNAAAAKASLSTQIDEWTAKHLSANEELEHGAIQLQRLAFDLAAYANAVAALDSLRGEVAHITRDLAIAEADLRSSAERLRRAEAALAAHDERAGALTQLEAKITTHELAAIRLNDFRVAQAAAVRPEMEELISGFVNELTDGRHPTVTVNEDFSLTLQKDGVDEQVVSGGTEDLAALAQRIAISVMISQRAGHPLSLLWLDEPFLSSDETRRGNVLNFIRSLRDRFSQVVMISHVEETRTAADHLIELHYDEDEGCTRVTTAPASVERRREAA